MELIPIISNGDVKAVDGRELHKFLEVGRDFTNWIKDRIEKYDFIENEDYQIVLAKFGELDFKGVTKTDYIISLDMAKELAMVEKNEKGKQARKYFIEVEKKARELVTQPAKLPEGDIGVYLLDVAKRMIQAEDERNMAIKTKAWISDKKTASAMGKYGALVKKTKKLEETVGIYKAVMSISVRSDVRTYSGTDNVQSILNTVLGEIVDVDAILCDMGFQKDLPVQLGYKLMNAGQAYSNSSTYTDRKGVVRFNWDYRRTAIAILEFLNK